jgi:hypothetical protein
MQRLPYKRTPELMNGKDLRDDLTHQAGNLPAYFTGKWSILQKLLS